MGLGGRRTARAGKQRFWKRLALTTAALCSIGSVASATENGRNPFPNGLNGTEIGNLPPQGVYLINEIVSVQADRFNNSNGDKAFPNFKLDVTAYAPRFLWNSGHKILGGDAAIQLVVPFVYTDLNNPPPAPFIPALPPFGHENRFAVGDPIVTPLLGWHGKTWHAAVGADFNIPVGQYDRNHLVNAGLNTFIFSPAVAVTYYPTPDWDLSVKATIDHYSRNDDTKYKSGDSFLLDYAVNRHVAAPGGQVFLGLGGYVFKQYDDDELNGVKFLDGFRGQAYGLGPAITYQHHSGARVELKYQKDFSVENRPEGRRIFLRIYMKLH